ncbi:MAG TPA: DUF4190 domain-containing protein [Thermoanaerobaculia bacterium]|nr:DUF4190 domain-containing protein [Thermoanaerobaculia bacterium]
MYPPSAPPPPPDYAGGGTVATGGAGGAPPGATPPGAATSKGIAILVLGIVGLACCQLTAPIAWVLGHQELKAIQAGMAPPANYALAQIGMVLGVLGTVLLAFGLLWVFAFGGLAVMSVLLNQ